MGVAMMTAGTFLVGVGNEKKRLREEGGAVSRALDDFVVFLKHTAPSRYRFFFAIGAIATMCGQTPGPDRLFAPHTCWGKSYVTLGSTRVSTNRF